MLKKLVAAVATMLLTMGFAFAQVDANKADQAALDGIKGIGPAMSKRIIDERSKNGAFKDWSDLETRVKGIGDKNSVKFSEAGLTVNGQSKPGSAAKAKSAKPAAAATPTTATDTKAADAKPVAADKEAKPKKEKKSKKDKDAKAADDAKK